MSDKIELMGSTEHLHVSKDMEIRGEKTGEDENRHVIIKIFTRNQAANANPPSWGRCTTPHCAGNTK